MAKQAKSKSTQVRPGLWIHEMFNATVAVTSHRVNRNEWRITASGPGGAMMATTAAEGTSRTEYRLAEAVR
jgi:hypothetical protein